MGYLDKLFASTQALSVLKLLVSISMSMGVGIFCLFRHHDGVPARSPNEPPIFVWPPDEYSKARTPPSAGQVANSGAVILHFLKSFAGL